MTKEEQLREELAAYAHEAWSGWMEYLFSKCGGNTIPQPLVERWQRQMDTPYADLPKGEKESDRKEADKMIWLFLKDGLRSMTEVFKRIEPVDPCAKDGHSFVIHPIQNQNQLAVYCTKCAKKELVH